MEPREPSELVQKISRTFWYIIIPIISLALLGLCFWYFYFLGYSITTEPPNTQGRSDAQKQEVGGKATKERADENEQRRKKQDWEVGIKQAITELVQIIAASERKIADRQHSDNPASGINQAHQERFKSAGVELQMRKEVIARQHALLKFMKDAADKGLTFTKFRQFCALAQEEQKTKEYNNEQEELLDRLNSLITRTQAYKLEPYGPLQSVCHRLMKSLKGRLSEI